MVSIGHISQIMVNALVEEIKGSLVLFLWGFFNSFAKCFCLSDEDSDSFSPRYSYSEDSK